MPEKEIDAIDDIDDIMGIARTMTSLGVLSKELRIWDETKKPFKETFQLSEKKHSWTAEEVRFCRSC